MRRYRTDLPTIAVLLLVGLLSIGPAAAAERSRPAGYVDGSALIARAGEEALTVEISLHGALLKNEQDVHLFERMIFLSRREGR